MRVFIIDTFCRRLQAHSDRTRNRLRSIQSGEVIVVKQSPPSTVLIDDMQENTSIGQEVNSKLIVHANMFLRHAWQVQFLRRCVGQIDNPGVLLSHSIEGIKSCNVLIALCRTTEKTLKGTQYCTTIRVDFTAATIVITDCNDIVVSPS